MHRRMTCRWVSALGAGALLACPLAVRADAVDDEYVVRFKALRPDDVAGHLELAKWCRDQQRWALVAQQCRHIQKYEPDQAHAKLLLDTAMIHLAQQAPQNETGKPAAGGRTGGSPRVLTDMEIQKVRRAELDRERTENVPIKIDREALKEYLEWASARGTLTLDRAEFAKLPRAEQAQMMLRDAPERFGDKITISGDPERLRVFDRTVMPIVLRGCATADCHGGSGAGGFQLHGGRSPKTNAVYANFLLLQDYRVGEKPVIDRNQPSESLLLTYGLPPRSTASAKPFNHSTALTPIFADEQQADYQAVLQWLQSLPFARPDYGVDLTPPPPTGSPPQK